MFLACESERLAVGFELALLLLELVVELSLLVVLVLELLLLFEDFESSLSSSRESLWALLEWEPLSIVRF